MHMAPRRLQIFGAVSRQVQPWRSILPGCGLAIAFTRAYVREVIRKLVIKTPGVSQTLFVDDFAQQTTGSVRAVKRKLAPAAVSFVLIARELELAISVKSTIVTSHPAITRYVSEQLELINVKLHHEPDGARDLGVLYCLRRTRRTGIIQARL